MIVCQIPSGRLKNSQDEMKGISIGDLPSTKGEVLWRPAQHGILLPRKSSDGLLLCSSFCPISDTHPDSSTQAVVLNTRPLPTRRAPPGETDITDLGSPTTIVWYCETAASPFTGKVVLAGFFHFSSSGGIVLLGCFCAQNLPLVQTYLPMGGE